MKKLTCSGYARDVIEKHLKKVEYYKKIAGEGTDVEGVHQSRVELRRIRNALWIFKGILSLPDIEKYVSRLRKATKKMGEARDLDTFIKFLKGLKNDPQNKSYKQSIGYLMDNLVKDRISLQSQVREAVAVIEKDKALGPISKALKNISGEKGDNKEELYKLARNKILKRLNMFLTYKKFVKEPSNVDGLHKMRVAAKKLRYTLECFQPIYGKEFSYYIDIIKNIQRVLGRVHDLDVWVSRVPGYVSLMPKAKGIVVYDFSGNFNKMRSDRYDEFIGIWERSLEDDVWRMISKCIKQDPQDRAHQDVV